MAFDSAGAGKSLRLICGIERKITSENEYAGVFGHGVMNLLVARESPTGDLHGRR